jgi:hypothetical protein
MNRGDVVTVDWPFSDRTGSKLRPAVAVQADFLNGTRAHFAIATGAWTYRGAHRSRYRNTIRSTIHFHRFLHELSDDRPGTDSGKARGTIRLCHAADRGSPKTSPRYPLNRVPIVENLHELDSRANTGRAAHNLRRRLLPPSLLS